MYLGNKRAWMTIQIFRDWLLEFDEYISHFRERRLSLTIDNASCNKKTSEQIELKKIKIDYLPPNTTSLTQPIDADIIVSMNCRSRRKKVLQALEVIFDNENDK